jgi:hypothetical protein
VEERTVSDFLDVKRREITERLKELKPVVDEYGRLEAAASALAKVGGSKVGGSTPAAAAPRRKKGPGRPRGSGKRTRVSTPAVSTPAAAAAVSVEATPAAAAGRGPVHPNGRKKVGRPKGSGKKVGRPPGSGKNVGRPKGSGGRRKGSGKRAIEAVSLVQGQPGITIPELAAKMDIKQNYLYRVLPGLQKEGKLEKKGRGWYPKAG